MNKITPEAKERMAAHTIQDQLAQAVELNKLRVMKAVSELEGKLIERRIRRMEVEIERRRQSAFNPEPQDESLWLKR